MKSVSILFSATLFLLMSEFSNGQENPAALINELSSLPELNGSSQAVIILGTGKTKSAAYIYFCEKNENGWSVLPGGFPAGIGWNGFAGPGEKREGDGKSPTGVFPLSLAFGYSDKCETRMPYRQAMTNDFWVDDPDSQQYNTWVHGTLSAKSAE